MSLAPLLTQEERPAVRHGGVGKGVTEGIFLAKTFFFTVLTLLMKRIARMDLADGFSAASGEVQGDSTQLIKF